MQTFTTPYGELAPQSTANDLRHKEILPVEFHTNGTVKSLPLEKQTIIATPAGDIPAELVSFHENGKLNRIFPLNGKLSGYWSQEDEASLAKPITLNTPAGSVTSRIISASFYDNGALRSVTLWPGDTVSVSTPVGHFETRIGISFSPEGEVKSVEPAKPTSVMTQAGKIMAYDPDAVGVNGDDNSLVFDDEGNVRRVTTTLSMLKAVHPNGTTQIFKPGKRESLCSEAEEEVVPMIVEITPEAISIRATPLSPATAIPMESHVFFAEPYLPQLMNSLEMMRCSV